MIKTKSPLSSMLFPKSIAIIGASGDKTKIGYQSVSNLKNIGYRGDVHLVNPKYKEIEGFPCYQAISSLPMDVDLAMVSINATKVLTALEQLEKINVKSIIVLSSGYAETGEDGAILEAELTNFSERTGIAVCGPNTLGIANFKENMIASFSSLTATDSDPVAFVTQSGAVGSLSYTNAKDMGIGYRYFVSTGNEAGTDFFDYVHFLSDQDDLKVIAGYLEGARDFNKMEKAIEACHKNNKPLVLMKVGNSQTGAEAASSHTASVAGNAQLYRNYFDDRNVVRVADEEELTDTIGVFAKTPPTTTNGGVAIITQSGGAGIIMADQCDKKNIELAHLSSKTKEELKKVLPAYSTVANPIDITAQVAQSPEPILDALSVTLQDDHVESIVLYLQMTDDKFLTILPRLSEIINTTDKRVIFCWSGVQAATKEKILQYKNLCWIPNPTRSINALANVINYYRNRRNKHEAAPSHRLTKEYPSKIIGKMNEWESKNLLSDYGLSIPKGQLVKNEQEIENIQLSFPVVMKVVSSEIEHKSEYSLVKLNINSLEKVKENYKIINGNIERYCKGKSVDGILIEEMAPQGIEVIIGAINDPVFGPSVMFGLGGIFVEVLKDVVILPVPINKDTAISMIKSVKNYKILNGARGNYYDIEALSNTIVRISEFCVDNQDSLIEFDINPLIVHCIGKGVTAVDAFIIGKELERYPNRF
ncbi:acetate--CoA ligase family protein [Oceanobacillus saliphilus]|uniref:acetate--CoA ligase family protein n=1 Tax=Oceanobacillus saliphilus TaxID=2925834 RepID=UPI00201DB99D|nr:acetate--CoA ligase family protein [Oceanobacillus saliphilus]